MAANLADEASSTATATEKKKKKTAMAPTFIGESETGGASSTFTSLGTLVLAREASRRCGQTTHDIDAAARKRLSSLVTL